MKIKPFGVEIWMNEHENDCKYNLAETCCASISVRQLLELTGESERHLQALLDLRMTYGDITGSPAIKEAICALYSGQKPENITITHGGIGANALSLYTLVERGDRVVSVLPTYQQHYSIPEAIGADVQILRLRPENRWLPDLDELRNLATPGTKLICINNPNNPTGALMDETMLREIVEIARGCGAWLLCDEVYRGVIHRDGDCTLSVADLYERGISTASLSKPYSLAGLRVGWVAGPPEFIEQVNGYRDYHIISVGMVDDYLGTLALRHRDRLLHRNVALARHNADLLAQWMQAQPLLSYIPPAAGTTAFVKFEPDMPSAQFCQRLQDETGVFFVPGSAFDVEGHFRIGFANETPILEEGLAVFSNWLKQF